jgi:hypothetical protein
MRLLTGAELATLKAKVQTIQCSNDIACPYCRSPFAILDPEVVRRHPAQSPPTQRPAATASA